MDGVADCLDGCPNDPQKTGAGTLRLWCADIDTDGDGTLDCNDACPTIRRRPRTDNAAAAWRTRC